MIDDEYTNDVLSMIYQWERARDASSREIASDLVPHLLWIIAALKNGEEDLGFLLEDPVWERFSV